MKTIIKGREFKVKRTRLRLFYWSTRAVRWLPVKAANVIFTNNELAALLHVRGHAGALMKARAMRSDGAAHARLMQEARIHRYYFTRLGAVEA